MSVRTGMAWMTFAQGGFLALQFIGSVIIARLLTPYETGVFAVAAATVGVLAFIQTFGLAGLVIREEQVTEDLLSTAFTVNAGLSAILSLSIAALAEIGGRYLGEPGVAHAMLVIALQPLIAITEFLPASRLERGANFNLLAKIGLLRAFCSTAATIAFAFAGFSYMSMAFGSLLSGIVGATAMNIVGRQFVSYRFTIVEWRRITSFGLQMMTVSGFSALTGRLGEFFLGRILGLAALGFYSRAFQMNALLWDNIHMVIGKVVFVDLAEVKRSGRSLRERYLQTVELVTAVLWPAFLGLGIVAGPVIATVYGDKWLMAATPLSLMCVGGALLVSITMTWEVFVICKETVKQTQLEVIRSTLSLALFVGGSAFGLVGVGASRIADAMVAVVLYRGHLRKLTDTQEGDLRPIYGRSALLTILATLPAAVVMGLHGWSAHTPFIQVMAAVAVGLLGWTAGLRVLDHPAYHELSVFLAKTRAQFGGARDRVVNRRPEC